MQTDDTKCTCSQGVWRRLHYRSDFALTVEPRGCPAPGTGEPGEPVDITGNDFTLEVRAKGSPVRVSASRKGGVLTPGCSVDAAGRIRAAFDSHGLPPGRLYCRLTVEIPDAEFPDGFRRLVWEFPAWIELVNGDVCPADGEVLVSAIVPLLGMEEITQEEVAAMFEQEEGSPLSALRPATDEEIDSIFHGEETAAAHDTAEGDAQGSPQEGAQP